MGDGLALPDGSPAATLTGLGAVGGGGGLGDTGGGVLWARFTSAERRRFARQWEAALTMLAQALPQLSAKHPGTEIQPSALLWVPAAALAAPPPRPCPKLSATAKGRAFPCKPFQTLPCVPHLYPPPGVTAAAIGPSVA